MSNDSAGLTIPIRADFEPIKSGMRETAQLGAQFGRSITSAFENAVFKGKDLGDVLRNLALSFSKIAFKAAFQATRTGCWKFLLAIARWRRSERRRLQPVRKGWGGCRPHSLFAWQWQNRYRRRSRSRSHPAPDKRRRWSPWRATERWRAICDHQF